MGSQRVRHNWEEDDQNIVKKKRQFEHSFPRLMQKILTKKKILINYTFKIINKVIFPAILWKYIYPSEWHLSHLWNYFINSPFRFFDIINISMLKLVEYCTISEDPLEKEMATHSSILAWRIPWTEKPGRLWSMGLQESDTTEWVNHYQRKIIEKVQNFLYIPCSINLSFKQKKTDTIVQII